MFLPGRALLYENAQQCLRALQRLPTYQHLLLQPFTTSEVQQYMRVALDREDVPDQTALDVRERTGGLPLYVEQVPSPAHVCSLSRLHFCHSSSDSFSFCVGEGVVG